MTTKLQTGTIERDATDADAKNRFFIGHTKGVDTEQRTVDGIASTINLDRDREVILPSAFSAKLAKFADGSAPFLAAHTHRTQTGMPSQIGWVRDIRVEDTRVAAKFRFAETDLAGQWWKLASDPEGKGIAFSIGFIPTRWTYGSVADQVARHPALKGPLGEAGLKADDKVRVYTEIELLEVSAVPVPSNREALQILAAKLFGANSLGDPGAPGPELIDKFIDGLAGRVLEGLTEALGEVLRQQAADLAAEIAEIKSLLPDDVHGGGRDIGGGPDDVGGDPDAHAGGGERAHDGKASSGAANRLAASLARDNRD